jgi:hypothetical protein
MLHTAIAEIDEGELTIRVSLPKMKTKEEMQQYKKEWYLKNIERIKFQRKERNLKNHEINKKRDREYYKTHKEQKIEYRKNHLQEIKEYKKIYKNRRNELIKIKRKTDIDFKLISNLRGRLYKALKRNSKLSSILILLDCSIEQLKQHLQSKFQLGMSFNNYGKWHIDHIIPCARFNFSKLSEQKKCFNYKNLQPLWAEENLSKSRS